MILYFVVIIVILTIIFLAFKFNTFIGLRNKVRQSNSAIDIYLTQRFDLIPNLVECVKAYCKHEEEVFTKVAELRSKYQDSDKDLKTGAELNNTLNKVLAIGESYPELKANEQFIELEKTLVKMESYLQAARRVYNGDVTIYNTAISTFPNNIIAKKLFEFKEFELFQIEEYKKNNININF